MLNSVGTYLSLDLSILRKGEFNLKRETRELRQLSDESLKKELQEARNELRYLQGRNKAGYLVTGIREKKRRIARILTILNERRRGR